MKPTRTVARGSAVPRRYATAAMISATPALSSAPSSVVPSLVTMSCPIRGRERRLLGRVEHLARIARQHDRLAGVVLVHDRGDAASRATRGVVSTCAMRPITGAPGVPGSVAKT